MRAKFTVLCVAVLASVLQSVSVGQDSCKVPHALAAALGKKYSAALVVRLKDLSPEDRELFEKDHGTDCPGLVSVDFYGDGKPTWALVLIPEGKQNAELVVAHASGDGFEITKLDDANQKTAVVWRQPQGVYRDLQADKTIRAAHSVIVFAGYESWAVLYAWTGKHVEKVWLSD
jgi:hypothetical protein